MTLQPGIEVAQIDWDGSTSQIDWVTIDAINIGSETPIINVTNCIKKGASGGGVLAGAAYWNNLEPDTEMRLRIGFGGRDCKYSGTQFAAGNGPYRPVIV